MMTKSSIMDQKSHNIWTNKVKPRDFKFKPKVLNTIGAENYDQKEDINQMAINVEEAINKLKIEWKQMNEVELRAMIKRQVIAEVCRIEERKHVRREQAEIVRKKKAKAELE